MSERPEFHSPLLTSMTAVILAGGMGLRLRSVISDRPKVMAEVAGRPFVEWLVAALRSYGIRHVVFCVGYMASVIEEHFGNGASWDMSIDYSCDTDLLGTGGALRKCLHLVKSDPVLVLNGDSYCEVDIPAFIQWHNRSPKKGSLVLTKLSDTGRYGRVHIGENGEVTRFDEKPSLGTNGWINAGIYGLSHELICSIPSHKPISLERETFPQWAAQGLFGYCGGSRFIDIGTPDSYVKAEAWFHSLSSVS